MALALLGGVLVGVPAVGASQQPSSAPQQEALLDAEGESISAVLQTVETTNREPSATSGEASAPGGGLAPPDAPLGVEDGLAPQDGLGGPELGEAVQELGVLDLVGPDGVWVMRDGGSETSLRLLDAAEIAELGEERSLAASVAATAYAPGAGTSNASAAAAGSAAKPDSWFVSDAGELLLLVGGVNVLFGLQVSALDIDAVWERHGVAPGRVSRLGELPNAFLVRTVSDAESLRLADALSAEPGVDAAVPNTFTPFEEGQTPLKAPDSSSSTLADARQRCNLYDDLWADELSSCSWHLDASGDYRFSKRWEAVRVSDPVIDINIGDVWSTTMGAGVTVAVVDRNWTATHEDLRDNADTSRSTNWAGFTSESDPRHHYHGTAVAGVVGARDNTVGGRGVAPRVTLVNYDLLDNYSLAREVEALTLNKATVAVANHSYGTRPRSGLAPETSFWQRGLETSLAQGFGGKGTSHVKSAGNGRDPDSRRYWSALEAGNNYRGIISVCAVASSGLSGGFSEEGPSLWVCGLARDAGQAGILTTVGQDIYYAHFGGTSAAAPMVSGVIALMRSANAELTWRDVKVILADTAQKVDAQDSGWMSGARKYSSTGPVAETYSFSYKYGFGLVDAKAAVDAAVGWTLLPPMQTFTAAHNNEVSLPARGQTVEVALDLQTAIEFTEHVKVSVSLDTADVRDYRWTLVSPTGTESLLAPEAEICNVQSCSMRGWFDFGSSRHLGENARGTWKLKIQHMPTDPDCADPVFKTHSRYDEFCDAGFREVLRAWSVEVTGHSSSSTVPISLSVASPSAAEGGSVDATVSVGGAAPTQDLVVHLASSDVSAQAGADYTVPASVTVPAGSSSAIATISVPQDSIHEGTETFTVRLGPVPQGYRPASEPVTVVIADDDPLPVLTLHAASASVVEGGSVAVSARLRGASSKDVAVDLSATPVAPAVASDGQLGSPAVLRIPAGSTSSSGTVAFAASQNEVYELSGAATKKFMVTGIAAGGNGVANPAAVAVGIDDDDPVPSISITAGPAVAEGSAAEFTLSASPVPSADLAVGVTVAQHGAFGVTTGVRTVTIPASGSAVLALSTTDDSEAEADGSVTVTVAAGTDYSPPPSPSKTLAVFDDDTARPLVSIVAGSTVVEGSAAEFTLSASPVPSADLAVSVTVAQQGAFGVTVGARTVTIPASGSAVLSVATTADSIKEPNGTITVTLADDFRYDLAPSATATVAVVDDVHAVVPVQVSLSSADASVSENGGSTDVEIALSRTLLDGETVSVPITVTGTPGSDWTLGDPTQPGVTRTGQGTATAVKFGPGGRTAVLRFTAVDDDATVDRPITFAFGTGARAPSHTGVIAGITLGAPLTVTITDHDQKPACAGMPTLSVADASAVRGGTLVFRFSLSCRASSSVVAYYYLVRDGDIDGLSAGVSFDPGVTSGSASVPAGQSSEVSLHVVWAPGVANSHRVPEATGTIVKTVPVVSVSAGAGVSEGNAATFTLSAVPVPTSPVTVAVDVSQSGDFVVSSARRTVVLSGASATLAIATRDDAADEADGSVSVTLVDGASYDVGTSSTATVSVADDDVPLPVVSITAGSGGTEGTSATFALTASSAPTADLDVSVTVAAAGDFGVTAGTQSATILAGTTGATLSVATSDDSVDEPDGSVTATLAAGSGYTVGSPASRTVQVLDDDDPPPVIPEISIVASGDVTEGSGAVFTVTASQPKRVAFDVSVTVSASGEWGVAAGSRTVSFAANAATATLTIPTVGDSVDEADGSVSVSLDAPGADAGYTVSSARSTAWVAVADDDVDPLTVYMIFFSRSIEENGAGYDNQAQFAIAPTRALRSWETLTVPLRVTGGDEGTHWTMRDRNDPDAVFANEFEVTFGPGDDGVVLEPGDQRVELVLTAVDDSDWVDQEITVWYGTGARAPTLNGSTEGVTLGISWGPDGVERADGSTTVVIIDSDEPPPQVDITAATGGTEGADATFTVTASKPTTADLDVTVDVASAGEWGATVGTQTVTIPKGATQATVTVSTTDDSVDEPDGSVTATLRAGSGYTVGQQSTQSAQIADDDDPPPEPAVPACAGNPRVSVADATAARGDDLEFVISLSCRSARDVTVYYAVALDRKLGNVVTFTIDSGDTDATVAVPTQGIDADIDFHIVYLIGAANNTAKATATITD